MSINTQVLGFLLQEVTNRSISEYLYEKIWNPLGMEDSAYFILDNVEDEIALGGLNATLRDYAKFGLLYLKKVDGMIHRFFLSSGLKILIKLMQNI